MRIACEVTPAGLRLEVACFIPPSAHAAPRLLPPLMKSIPIERLGYLAALWLCGTLALAATTWVCFQFQLNLATTSLAYLIVIVLLSLLDSLISSIVLSVAAVG